MKNKIFKVMAAVTAAIICLCSINVFAMPSTVYANKDYRNIDVINKQGVKINKPTAQFAANRIAGGEVADVAISYDGYDLNEEYPTLICYVGDTLTFTDMSRDNNGGELIEWDWQYEGHMGKLHNVYKRNVINETSFNLTEPGETFFYLCVRNDADVKNGCCDPWSENGNHQTVGKNKWFPKGAYWYFTAVRVIVKPVREAIVNVRYWDAQNNAVFYEETINAGKLLEDTQTVNASVHITDWEGYEYSGWNVQLTDGTIQYRGDEREVEITLAGWIPEKWLNVEFFPYMQTSVAVRYWDKTENAIIYSETLSGEKIVRDKETKISVKLKTPEGYKTDGWNVQLIDGTIQYEDNGNPAIVTLSTYHPKKIINVKCYQLNNKKVTVNYIDSETDKVIKTTEIKPNQKESGTITTEIEFENVPGYVIEDWVIKTPDDSVEKTGTEAPVSVTLTEQKPHKILDVNCFSIEDDEETEPAPSPTITVKPNGICDGAIEWTETDSHRVIIGYNRKGNPIYGRCNHAFEYKTILRAEADITPEILKSGYGFEVEVDCDIETEMIENDGCRNWGNNRRPDAMVKKPTTATVFVPWDMTNRLGSQGKSISMVPDGRLKFILPESPVSEIGTKKIYTPVELPGTKEEPQSHSFEIYIGGGGVGEIEFCQKIDCTITINGDMYEDDFSGAN